MAAFTTRYGRATLGEVLELGVDDAAEYAEAINDLLAEEKPATPLDE